jgi:hypothetical protein
VRRRCGGGLGAGFRFAMCAGLIREDLPDNPADLISVHAGRRRNVPDEAERTVCLVKIVAKIMLPRTP